MRFFFLNFYITGHHYILELLLCTAFFLMCRLVLYFDAVSQPSDILMSNSNLNIDETGITLEMQKTRLLSVWGILCKLIRNHIDFINESFIVYSRYISTFKWKFCKKNLFKQIKTRAARYWKLL